MIPLRDHIPLRRTPWVTRTLIALNVAVYLATAPWAGNMGWLWVDMALYPIAISHGMFLWGLITHMFVHASLMHIGGNMLFLWIFGDNLEDEMGPVGFLVFYLLCGLAAAGAEIAADPMTQTPMVGASGAIAGVMGGYLLLFPRARIDVIVLIVILIRWITIPAWVLLALWFAVQLFSGLGGVGGDIAYWAHAGGFVTGIILTVPVLLRNGGRAFWASVPDAPRGRGIAWRRSRIPRVRR